MLVDHDGMVAQLDADLLEADALGRGHAAGRVHDEIGVERGAVLEFDDEVIAVAVDARDLGIEAQIEALLLHLVGEEGAAIVVEAAQEQRPAMDLRHLRAEAVEDAGELDRDIAAADDDDALGQSSRGRTLRSR